MTELLSGYDAAHRLMFRVYAAKIPDADNRVQHKLAHLTAYDLLSAALEKDFGIRHAKIRREGLGKPQLLHENLHVNVTHCHGLAAAAVGYLPLGIDAETPRAFREKMLPRICTPAEAADILQTTESERHFRFSQYWTLKEAYTKYTGQGIGLRFSTIGFSLGAEIAFHHPNAENLQFYQQILENQFVISLCVPRRDYQIDWKSDAIGN